MAVQPDPAMAAPPQVPVNRMEPLLEGGRYTMAVLNSDAGARIRTATDRDHIHAPLIKKHTSNCALCGASKSLSCACCGVTLCPATQANTIQDACWTVFHQEPAVNLVEVPRYKEKLAKFSTINAARGAPRLAATPTGHATPAAATPSILTHTPPTLPLPVFTPVAAAGVARVNQGDTDARTPPTMLLLTQAVLPQAHRAVALPSADNMGPRTPGQDDRLRAAQGLTGLHAMGGASPASTFSPSARRHQVDRIV